MIRHCIYIALLVCVPVWADSNADPNAIDPVQGKTEEPTGVLSWETVQELILTRHAGLRAAALSVSKAQARQEQVKLWDNPELVIEMENLGGTSPRNDFRGAETTITVTQPMPAPGKRALQRDMASSGKRLAQTQVEQAKRDVLSQAAQAFWQVLAMQAQADLADKQFTAAEALLIAVEKRIQSGKDSPVELNRARIVVADQRIHRQTVQSKLNTARVQLAVLWGGRDRFERIQGDFGPGSGLPDAAVLKQGLASHPSLAQWTQAVEQAKTQKDLARKEAYSDWAITGGIKRLEDEGETTGVLGVVIPLPVFNRNQGRRKEAVYHLAQVRALKESHEQRLSADLQTLTLQTRQAYEQVVTLKNDILPQAKEAYERSILGYEQGRFDYLHVLDAQRQWFEQSQRYLETLLVYGLNRIQVASMTGLDFDFETSFHEGIPHEN